MCSLPDFYQTYQREKRIDLATAQCLAVITPSQDAVLYTTNYFLDWTLFDYYFPERVHAQIESSNTSQCFTSSDPEIWLFMEHALSDAELNAASDNGYSHTNVCNSTFAEGPGEDSFYYIYKFQNPQTPPRNHPHPLSLTRRLCICYTFAQFPAEAGALRAEARVSPRKHYFKTDTMKGSAAGARAGGRPFCLRIFRRNH